MEGMRALGRLALVFGAPGEVISNVDALDHEHLVLQHDDAFGIGGQPTVAGVDPARLQRAPQGPRESTSGSGHHVVERGGMVGILPGGGAVVLADLVMRPEHDRFALCGNVGAADRPAAPTFPQRAKRSCSGRMTRSASTTAPPPGSIPTMPPRSTTWWPLPLVDSRGPWGARWRRAGSTPATVG